ncbi:MAG: hypothetical protein KC635_16100 [Myxococcales bacterium]|nr:hypothetical protein [Myxococcales bacterium]MCB9734775.1 hypothetical protein [Deltaproteobacteria bacterium]
MNDVAASAPAADAGSAWSPELRVLLRPRATYARLRAAPDDARPLWRGVRGPLLWLLVVGAFVSFTTAGRLVWWEILLSASAWAFLPLLQVAWLAAATARVPVPLADRVDLWFRGQAPIYLWFLALSALCLFTPHARLAIEPLVFPIVLALAAAIGWGAYLTFVCLRVGFRLGRASALLRTLGFYVGYGGTLVGWYLVTDNLQPLLAART